MMKLSGICFALLGLALTVNGQSGRDESDPRCFGLPNGNGNIMAEGTNCRYYLSCFNNTIKNDPMACAADTFFNPQTGDCDAEGCDDPGRSSDYDCVEGALQEDCNLFNICFNVLNNTIYRCGEDTIYHNVMRVCVHPENYPDLPGEQNCRLITR